MPSTKVSVSDFAGEVEMVGATLAALAAFRIPDAEEGCCCMLLAWGGCDFMSGWVCCIFTVAFGSAGAELFGASVGRLMRAVSFFGEAGFATMPDPPGAGGGMMPDGPGFSGMVGLPESGGGLGGGLMPLAGLESGGGAGGAEGRDIGGGVAIPEVGSSTLEVSFFGVMPPPDSGMLIRTVSRLATGLSVLGGSVMRMVSFLSDSSFGSADDVGFSSDMALCGNFFSISVALGGVNSFVEILPGWSASGVRHPPAFGSGIVNFSCADDVEFHVPVLPVRAMTQWNEPPCIPSRPVRLKCADSPPTTTTNLIHYSMKRILTILTIAALGVASTAPAQAGKGKGKKNKGADILATYDKDGNGKIDGAEVDAIRADFKAGKPEVVALDTNKDGTLSDEEIAAAGGKKHRKKKNK